MPIQVTCPKCLTRFSVSDKFAGKKGPCPKCKSEITVPDVGDQVIIHAPPDDSPKDSKGRSILKPIERQETRVSRKGIVITVVASLLVVAAALALRLMEVSGNVRLIAIVVGAIGLAPPLVWAGYAFARDQELEPYRGRELQVRVAILSAILAGLWLVYALVPQYVLELDKPSEMSLVTAAIMLVVVMGLGTVASMAVFELEFVGGLTHAGLYFVVTLLLAFLADVTLFGATPAPPGIRRPPARLARVDPSGLIPRRGLAGAVDRSSTINRTAGDQEPGAAARGAKAGAGAVVGHRSLDVGNRG